MSYALPVGKVVVLSTACWIKATVAHGVALVENVLKYLLEDNNNFILYA